MGKIIQVENLSKKYTIGHQLLRGKKTFREAISMKLSGLGRKFAKSLPKNLSSGSIEEFWALRDINFEVEQGDRVGIIGRNGAGKSTLLKVLSRITEPTCGRISLRGRIASLLEVGTGFNGELTGRENIFLNGAILGMHRAEIKQKFYEIVDFSGVQKFLDTPVKRYSSGMYVRLAFAVAAHLEPEILIVDEVLAVGDAEFQKKCLGKMDEVSTKEGRTVLFVSHNMSAIQRLCNKGILLESGKIIKDGESLDIIDTYQNKANAHASEYNFPRNSSNDVSAYSTKLRVEDLEGNLIDEIPIGKPWRVKIYFSVIHPINNLIVGLGMINKWEIPIRTSWTIPKNYPKGNYVAIFEEDKISFSPGKYRLLVGLSKGGHEVIEYLDEELWFTISEVIEKQERSVIDYKNGLIINQMKMSVQKSEEF